MKPIGIITDSIIANLPLMKIKRYYNNCEWYIPLNHYNYDKIYYSKIFNFTGKIDREEEFIVGGTGFNLQKKLPEEIDTLQPDYSIYPKCDYSLQYFSRGCIRKCKFCVVSDKEGYIHEVKPMNLNPIGKYIRVLDNNFFANKNYKEAINILQKYNQPVLFDSGIDLRIFNDKQGYELNKIKLYKTIHCAWDNPKQDMTYKIKQLIKFVKPYRITIYVLIGFDSCEEEDLYRVLKIKELNCNPFVMQYDKKDKYQKKFARWVNHKAIFNTVEWKEYK